MTQLASNKLATSKPKNPPHPSALSGRIELPSSLAEPLKEGDTSQTSRAFALGFYFLSGCLAISSSQFLGAPLSLINQEWYNAWIAFTKQSWGILTTTITQCWAPTVVRISGDKSVRGQLLKTADGNLLCNFPERIVLIANHQIYTDWLYLWWIGYTRGMHGHIYIVLKESLRNIPILGWGMEFFQFIFLKRNWEEDKPRLSSHLQKLKKPEPMWFIMFPEGTNLAPCTRKASKAWAERNGIRDLRHQLLPRSTGLQFCLQELRDTINYVYDCTIAYEGVPHGSYAQDIFTLGASYIKGHPPKSVNMYWRRFPLSSIPLDNPREFELWLRTRWTEKDVLLGEYLRKGRFPADGGVEKVGGKTLRGSGYLETEVKPKYWYEFLQIFAPVGLLAFILYLFYGAVPTSALDSAEKRSVMNQLEGLSNSRISPVQSTADGKTKKTSPAVSGKRVPLKDHYATLRPVPVKETSAPKLAKPIAPKTHLQPASKALPSDSKSTKPKTPAKPMPQRPAISASKPQQQIPKASPKPPMKPTPKESQITKPPEVKAKIPKINPGAAQAKSEPKKANMGKPATATKPLPPKGQSNTKQKGKG